MRIVINSKIYDPVALFFVFQQQEFLKIVSEEREEMYLFDQSIHMSIPQKQWDSKKNKKNFFNGIVSRRFLVW